MEGKSPVLQGSTRKTAYCCASAVLFGIFDSRWSDETRRPKQQPAFQAKSKQAKIANKRAHHSIFSIWIVRIEQLRFRGSQSALLKIQLVQFGFLQAVLLHRRIRNAEMLISGQKRC